MVALFDLFDGALYVQMRDEGYIRRQIHPTLPLAILNYSEKAQYEQRWNDVTLNCRGLIYNYETNEVVARGFKKFFNWDDSSQPYPPSGPVLRMPKMDGSLGILYLNPNHLWAVATRGSFASLQATVGTDILYGLADKGEIDLADLKPDRSYLTEIIFPQNRIVVDYGDQERLTLLDVLDTATGKADLDEFDRVYWLDKVERLYLPGGFGDTMVEDVPEGEEGFVFYWPVRDYRVKMKAAAYLELHRMIFSLSERSVWQRLGDGETTDDIAMKLPDEFHGWVKDVAERLIKERNKIVTEVTKEFRALVKNMKIDDTRKQFAAKASQSPNRAYLFMLYDGNDISDAVWKTLKPVGGKTVTTISEDVA